MRHLIVPRAGRRASRGLSIVEVMMALVVIALLASAGAPFYADHIANTRVREAGAAVLVETLHAQSEATKRNVPVRLRVALDGTLTTADVTDPAAPITLRTAAMPAPAAPTAAVDIVFGSNGQLLSFPAGAAVDIELPGKTCDADLRCPGVRVEAAGSIRMCGNRIGGCV